MKALVLNSVPNEEYSSALLIFKMLSDLTKNLVLYGILTVLVEVTWSFPFPGIFPLLSTGWYYKPGPTESIVLGLLVVKLLALRLGATVAGVPYHLNDIFDSNILPFSNRGKRSIFQHYVNKKTQVPLTEDEIITLERILLSLRRIDSHDCFIRYICQINQDNYSGKKISASDETWLNVFKLKPAKPFNSSEISVWDMYEDALLLEPTNCSKKYDQCPLTEEDFTSQRLMSGLF